MQHGNCSAFRYCEKKTQHYIEVDANTFVGINYLSMITQIPSMQNDHDNGDDSDFNTGLATKTKPKTKKPSLYRVLLLNDDFTPMEFVILVLERFFSKSRDQATQIMLHVHNNGVGECGVFTYEVAETKVTQVMDFAQKHQHPLQCVMEKN